MSAALTPPSAAPTALAAPAARVAPLPLGRPIVDAAFLADPYPTYEALRQAGPIHWSDEFFGGAWLLTSHADVEMALRDPRFSAQRTGGWVRGQEEARGELDGFQRLFARALLFLDAPDHTRIRKVLNAGFRPEALARLKPQIAQMVADLLDSADAAGARFAGAAAGAGAAADAAAPFDFMQAVARPLPVRVITALMGIEDADAAQHDFVGWSDDLATFIGAAQPDREEARRAQVSLLAMSRYFETLLARKRSAPGDDLVSRLAQAQAAGEVEGGPELLAQCAMLLFAGHETTRNLLGNGLQALLAHPAQWQKLQQAPELLPGALRELLRFNSPVQYSGRRVATDLTLHGQQLRRGDLVVALIGSANRDPARYTQPGQLNIERREGSALSFGSGPHVCIGAALTLMEAEAVFSQVLQRWPDLTPLDATPQWANNPVYRGLKALPVRKAALTGR